MYFWGSRSAAQPYSLKQVNMEIIYLIIGIVVGAVTGWLAGRLIAGRTAPASTTDTAALQQLSLEKSRLEERVTGLSREKENLSGEWSRMRHELQEELNRERERYVHAQSKLSEMAAINQNVEEKLITQKAEIETLQKRFTVEFENIANRLLEEKSQKFTEQNRTNLDVILNPLKEKIKEFEDKVDKAYKAENEERITLKTEIRNLVELNKQISEEANNLAQALKGDNKMQGNWGEVILEKVLERSGLVKDHEYKLQFSTVNEEGKRIQPDVVIMLPDNKHIIIDSKVSLVAYEQCVNCGDDTERDRFRKLHVDSVRNHIRMLSEKNYTRGSDINAPDFVLLFIPIEASFSVAVQGDQELFGYAWEKKVVIVSPSTLLATLKTIASIWKQEYQNRNAMEIARQGGDLYDKFVGFVEDLISVGKKMKDSQTAYEAAMNKLVQGKGNLVKRTEDLKKLGVKVGKNLPPTLIERAEQSLPDIAPEPPSSDLFT